MEPIIELSSDQSLQWLADRVTTRAKGRRPSNSMLTRTRNLMTTLSATSVGHHENPCGT